MPFELLLIPGGAFLAALVVGAAGFGDALIVAAIWLQVLAPTEAVPLVVAIGLIIHGIALWRLWGRLDFRGFWPFVCGGTLGVPAGSWLLGVADPAMFRTGVGVFLIAYAALNLLHPALGRVSGGGRTLDGAAGVVGGVMGGLAGLAGICATIWANLRGWPKERQRGLIQPFVFTINGMALGWLAAQGLVDRVAVERFLWCLPAIAAGAWIGLRLYGTLDDRQFGRIVLVLLIVLGVMLVV